MRREALLSLLKESGYPVSGTELAAKLGVTRQIIVQDVALLRAEHRNILSTNKGYILFDPNEEQKLYKKVLMVRHTTEQTLDELCTIVDHGAKVLDVSVEHELYGQISADLIINSRKDAEEFVEKLSSSSGAPLKTLTSDVHFHTIAAEMKEILEDIEGELRGKGYLVIC